MRHTTFDLHSATITEWALPANLRELLQAARAARPEHDVICLSYHVHENGREVVRMGSSSDPTELRTPCSTRLQAKDVIVWSVSATETTFDAVRTVTHVLLARVQLRASSDVRVRRFIPR
jgi:hypothetical protein